MHTITVKPFPKLVDGALAFVGVITRSHRTAVATTLLLPTSAVCRAAAADLVKLIEEGEDARLEARTEPTHTTRDTHT